MKKIIIKYFFILSVGFLLGYLLSTNGISEKNNLLSTNGISEKNNLLSTNGINIKRSCDNNNILNNINYNFCIDRFKLDLNKILELDFNKRDNTFGFNIFTHVYTYIIYSLFVDSFSDLPVNNIDIHNKFLGLNFYIKNYSNHNKKNKDNALKLIYKIKENYSKGITYNKGKNLEVDFLYNGYIDSEYFKDKNYIGYFNKQLKYIIDNKKYTLLGNFKKEFIFFYYYLNNLETKDYGEVCKQMICENNIF